ncbi:hypothetical protein Q5752_001383 [Cryptotrichosporon argae]
MATTSTPSEPTETSSPAPFSTRWDAASTLLNGLLDSDIGELYVHPAPEGTSGRRASVDAPSTLAASASELLSFLPVADHAVLQAIGRGTLRDVVKLGIARRRKDPSAPIVPWSVSVPSDYACLGTLAASVPDTTKGHVARADLKLDKQDLVDLFGEPPRTEDAPAPVRADTPPSERGPGYEASAGKLSGAYCT